MRLLDAKKDILFETHRHFYQAEEMENLFNIQKANNNIATFNRSFLGEMHKKLLVVEWPDLLELEGEFDYHNADMSISKIKEVFMTKLHFMEPNLKGDLIADVIGLADFFSGFKSKFRYSFDVFSKTMCPRFHVDFYSLRLIVTYVGKATQWTENSNVKLTSNEHQMLPIEIIDLDKYYDLKPMDVTLLKGTNYVNGHQAVAHRSPESNKQKRVLLRFEF